MSKKKFYQFVQTYTLKSSIKRFGVEAKRSPFKEMKQLRDRMVFKPVRIENLTELENKRAIESLMFLVKKSTINGFNQCLFYDAVDCIIAYYGSAAQIEWLKDICHTAFAVQPYLLGWLHYPCWNNDKTDLVSVPKGAGLKGEEEVSTNCRLMMSDRKTNALIALTLPIPFRHGWLAYSSFSL